PSRRLRTRVPSTPPLSGVAEPLYRTDRTGARARGSIGRGPAGGTRSRPGAGAVGAGIIAGRRGRHRRRPGQPAAEDSAEENPWLLEVSLTSRPLRRPRAASRVREAKVLLGSTTTRGRTMAPYEVVVAGC